jgi:DNA-binding transcriptional LysR family regulator
VPRAALPVLLEPLIVSFSRKYPEVEIEISASGELVDLAANGFDAGVRLGQFIAADMITVRLTPPFRLVVVGARDYLRRRSRPARVDDLRDHACLRLRRSNGAIAPWNFVSGNKAMEAIVSGPLIANDYVTLLAGAREGLGLTQVPAPIAAAAIKAGRLETVLDGFAPTAPGVFLYFPSRHQMMPKLRAFVDHVKAEVAAPARKKPRAG